MDEDGLAADLHAVRAGNGAELSLAGPGQGDPHGAARRHRLDLGRGAVGDLLAVPQQDDPVGVGVRFLQVVRGEQYRPALLGVLADRRPEAAPPFDVHPGGRLVQDKQFGVGDQCHGESEPLLLAA